VDKENCRLAVSSIDIVSKNIQNITDWVLQDFRDCRGAKEGNLKSGACGQYVSFIPESMSVLLL
jgi:hypothetical protein